MKTYNVEIKKWKTWVFVGQTTARSKAEAIGRFSYLLDCCGVHNIRATALK